MPQEVTAYRADDQSLHEDECAAAKRNVELLVNKSPLAENQPFARQAVDWLTGNAAAVRAVLEAHERACQKPAKGKAPSKTLERTRS